MAVKAKDDNLIHVLGGRDITIADYEAYIRTLSMKPLLTVPEAATYFNIGINRVQYLVQDTSQNFVIGGGLGPKGRNRKALIHREEFEKWLLAKGLENKEKN